MSTRNWRRPLSSESCFLLVHPCPRSMHISGVVGRCVTVGFAAGTLSSRTPKVLCGHSLPDGIIQTVVEATSGFPCVPIVSSTLTDLCCAERSPPIEEVIAAGVVPRFVEFLLREEYPQLQVRMPEKVDSMVNLLFSPNFLVCFCKVGK